MSNDASKESFQSQEVHADERSRNSVSLLLCLGFPDGSRYFNLAVVHWKLLL